MRSTIEFDKTWRPCFLIVFLIWKPSLSLSLNIEGMSQFKITVDREKQTGVT